MVVLAALATAGAATADTTTTTTTPVTTPTTTPTPPPVHPAHGSAKLYMPGIFVVHGDAVTVPKRRVEVDGVVHPYVAGQSVTIKAFLGRRLIRRQVVRITPSQDHSYGRFRASVSSPSAGIIAIEAEHARTSTLLAFKAGRRFAALDERAGPGSTGRFVQLVQQRLAALHFYMPQSGVFDAQTELALDAYHRLLHWGTYKTLDGRTASYLLNGWGAFKVRFPTHGRHAEGDLGLQLLALIDGSKVQYIFPISSGKPSTPTILGDFHVYRRVPGYLPDGMYFSSFFISGYAIHGYNPAPDYPASHGCMRLPISDAIAAFNWLAYGDWVDVYH